jgi:hypothetical protein
MMGGNADPGVPCGVGSPRAIIRAPITNKIAAIARILPWLASIVTSRSYGETEKCIIVYRKAATTVITTEPTKTL